MTPTTYNAGLGTGLLLASVGVGLIAGIGPALVVGGVGMIALTLGTALLLRG